MKWEFTLSVCCSVNSNGWGWAIVCLFALEWTKSELNEFQFQFFNKTLNRLNDTLILDHMMQSNEISNE